MTQLKVSYCETHHTLRTSGNLFLLLLLPLSRYLRVTLSAAVAQSRLLRPRTPFCYCNVHQEMTDETLMISHYQYGVIVDPFQLQVYSLNRVCPELVASSRQECWRCHWQHRLLAPTTLAMLRQQMETRYQLHTTCQQKILCRVPSYLAFCLFEASFLQERGKL